MISFQVLRKSIHILEEFSTDENMKYYQKTAGRKIDKLKYVKIVVFDETFQPIARMTNSICENQNPRCVYYYFKTAQCSSCGQNVMNLLNITMIITRGRRGGDVGGRAAWRRTCV